MSEDKSKYPIADMGEDFQPDAMEDFDARMKSGEFKDLSVEQIRRVYVEEEMDQVEVDEEHETLRLQIEREEAESDIDD